MSVSLTTNRVAYSGNGVTTAFAFSYPLHALTDLVVLSIDADDNVTTEVVDVGYTLSGSASGGIYPSGGTVTYAVAPATGTKVVIYRDPARTQSVDLSENDALPAETLERALDRAILLIQRLADLASRSVSLPDGYATSFDSKLPMILTPGSLLAVNSDGDGLTIFDGDVLPVITGSRSDQEVITTTGITPAGAIKETIFIVSNGGAVDVTANPQIAAGTIIGQELRLIGRSNTNTVLLEDGTGLDLNGAWLAEQSSVLELIWDGTNWQETSRR